MRVPSPSIESVQDFLTKLGIKPLMYTAIPYRASTGPEQGFPCVVFPHRENPVFISWDPCNENRFFPVGNTTQGKPCSHYRDGFAVLSVGNKKVLDLSQTISEQNCQV